MGSGSSKLICGVVQNAVLTSWKNNDNFDAMGLNVCNALQNFSMPSVELESYTVTSSEGPQILTISADFKVNGDKFHNTVNVYYADSPPSIGCSESNNVTTTYFKGDQQIQPQTINRIPFHPNATATTVFDGQVTHYVTTPTGQTRRIGANNHFVSANNMMNSAVCRNNADCPPGYTCQAGTCVASNNMNNSRKTTLFGMMLG